MNTGNGERGRGLTAQGHKEAFGGNGNVSYLDGGYMTVCYQNSLNYTLKKDWFYCMQIIY